MHSRAHMVQVEVIKEVEKIVEREKQVERIVEKIIEMPYEVPKVVSVEVPYEKIVYVEKPVVKTVYQDVPVPVNLPNEFVRTKVIFAHHGRCIRHSSPRTVRLSDSTKMAHRRGVYKEGAS